MKCTGAQGKPGTSIYAALEMINQRVESLALIMAQMTDSSGFYARVPVTQLQIDQLFQGKQ